MTHRPIAIINIGLSFGEKSCFEEFSSHIYPKQRIAITGANGLGKSMLLKIIQGLALPSTGEVRVPPGIVFGYVPQTILDYPELSGGERFNRLLTRALVSDPDLLCLDEPTNHLDLKNRRSLLAMLASFRGTLVVVSHDVNLLRAEFDSLWHIEEGRVHQFAGSYDDFVRERHQSHCAREAQKKCLKREKLKSHQELMRDQVRAKKKKIYGEKKYDGDKLALRSAQGRGQMTTNKNKRRIGREKEAILHELATLRLPEQIKPRFALNAAMTSQQKPVFAIIDGAAGYQRPLLTNINFMVGPGDRWAICGPNGCGKSTLVKALLADSAVTRLGAWMVPPRDQIAYMDQHYHNLDPELSALATIQKAAPSWSLEQCRSHLNDFLFRKNEEVNRLVRLLSGGEKARLSLAQMAANTPVLLILDEITNNLDLATREHVIQVLKAYPGTLLVISHDEDFLQAIGLSSSHRFKLSRAANKALQHRVGPDDS